MQKNIKIQLVISSNKIIYSDIENFMIGLKITNSNSEAAHFDVTKTKLFVNDIESIAWNLCTQNGTIINLAIPPKDSKTIQWPLGLSLFETTGEYQLKLKWDSFVQETKVNVTE